MRLSIVIMQTILIFAGAFVAYLRIYVGYTNT